MPVRLAIGFLCAGGSRIIPAPVLEDRPSPAAARDVPVAARDGSSIARVIARGAARPMRLGSRAGARLTCRARRLLLIARTKMRARLVYARVEMAVAPDVELGRRLRVEIDPGTRNRLSIGRASMIRDDVLLWLRGGSIEIGNETEIRRLCSLNSSGQLSVGSSVIVSFGVSVGCADRLTIEDLAAIGEYSSLTDSAHPRSTGDDRLVDRVESAPTRVGRSAWIGAQSVITSGVDIGDYSIVGAGSVVTRDVPSWRLAAGVPARTIRKLTSADKTDPSRR